MAQEIRVVVKGSSWDSDSRGFASIAGLSLAAGTEKAARGDPGFPSTADPIYLPFPEKAVHSN